MKSWPAFSIRLVLNEYRFYIKEENKKKQLINKVSENFPSSSLRRVLKRVLAENVKVKISINFSILVKQVLKFLVAGKSWVHF